MSKLNFPKTYRVIFAIVGLLPILGLLAYPFMPETIGMHWSYGNSVPDGYGGKTSGLIIICFLLMLPISLVSLIGIASAQMDDPRPGKFFEWFALCVALFLLYFYCLFLLWNVGLRFNFNVMVIGGLILFLIGIITLIIKSIWPSKIKRIY